MNIHEYNTKSEELLHRKIEDFMQNRYKSNEHIVCWFDLFIVDVKKRNKLSVRPEKIEIARKDYAELLAVMLKYPDLTFEDLPLYIDSQLYKQILVLLRFPAFGHMTNITRDAYRSNPVAVEMVTIQRDLYEIAGESMRSFLLQSYTPTSRFQDVSISIRMKKMEISIDYMEGNNFINSIYGMIDVDKVKDILHVKTNKGIEGALKRLCEKLPETETDIFWIVRWLDSNRIKYIHAEDVTNCAE